MMGLGALTYWVLAYFAFPDPVQVITGSDSEVENLREVVGKQRDSRTRTSIGVKMFMFNFEYVRMLTVVHPYDVYSFNINS